MPIKPENKHKYPKDWKFISERIRFDRAKNKCEFCGVINGEKGARDRFGEWRTEKEIDGLNNDEGEYYFKDFPKIITIVLTVAHLNHDESDCRDENLKALCQRCHLQYDAKHHSKNAAITREKKKGLINLFG